MAKQLNVTETKLEYTEVKLEESNKLKDLLQKLVEEFKENLDISIMVRWANSSGIFKESDIKQLKALLEQKYVSYIDTTKQDIGESGNYIDSNIINDESSS